MNEKMDMRISGSSTMPGGEYDRVSISGSGTVQGDLRCQSLSCSGSARVQGDVDCAGEVRSSGSSKVTGSITCESLGCSGAVKCEGSILSRGRIHSSGAMKVSGSLEGGEVDVSGGLEAADIRCQELCCSGAMNVSGGVEAEAVRISGMAGIPGLLNAETVEIAANRGIRIGSIGGGSIRIYQPQQKSLLGLFRSSCSCAQAGDIEGDDVDLEYTQADVVRGRRVRIGEGCSIGRVEYSESLDAWDGTVGEAVQTGE